MLKEGSAQRVGFGNDQLLRKKKYLGESYAQEESKLRNIRVVHSKNDLNLSIKSNKAANVFVLNVPSDTSKSILCQSWQVTTVVVEEVDTVEILCNLCSILVQMSPASVLELNWATLSSQPVRTVLPSQYR